MVHLMTCQGLKVLSTSIWKVNSCTCYHLCIYSLEITIIIHQIVIMLGFNPCLTKGVVITPLYVLFPVALFG